MREGFVHATHDMDSGMEKRGKRRRRIRAQLTLGIVWAGYDVMMAWQRDRRRRRRRRLFALCGEGGGSGYCASDAENRQTPEIVALSVRNENMNKLPEN